MPITIPIGADGIFYHGGKTARSERKNKGKSRIAFPENFTVIDLEVIMTNEEKAYIEKLNMLISEYQSTDRTLISIFIFVICLIAFVSCITLGYVWTIIIAIFIGIAVLKLGVTVKNTPIAEAKLAYRVCLVMENLIEIKQGDRHKIGDCHISSVGTGKHKELYAKFITLYPHLASLKLKRLSSVEVQIKDIYD